MKKKVLKELAAWAIYFLVILGLTYILITYVGQRTVVEGSSMESTLQDQDGLWLNKLTYRFSDPKRFDIVVFPAQYKKAYLIKRVIALPGETIVLDDAGNIFVDGELLVEYYGREQIDEAHHGRLTQEVTLGEDEYFVMGDNRNNSLDSRFEEIGNLKRNLIIGKVSFRILPFKKFGSVK